MVLTLAVGFVVDAVIEGRHDLQIRSVMFMHGQSTAIVTVAISRLDLPLEIPDSDGLYIF